MKKVSRGKEQAEEEFEKKTCIYELAHFDTVISNDLN